VDLAAAPGDDHFLFQDMRNHATLALSESFPAGSQDFTLTGEATLSPPLCADASDACSVVIKRLRVTIQDFSQPTTAGEVSVAGATLSLEAPRELPIDPLGQILIPAGSEVHTCAEIDGRSWHAAAATDLAAIVSYDSARQVFSLDAVLPVAIRADDEDCTSIALWARVTANGSSAQ